MAFQKTGVYEPFSYRFSNVFVDKNIGAATVSAGGGNSDVSGVCMRGNVKMASKMATNNKNGPLNENISNFHYVHNTLYFNTSVFIRISNAYREGI